MLGDDPMAKGKSGKSGTRDAQTSLTTLRSRPITVARPDLTSFQDLRSFDFEPATRPARLFNGQPARFSVSAEPTKKRPGRSTRSQFQHAQVAFSAPSETLVCVRRSRRREVLHALKKTGKGGQRRPRRSPWSNYKC